VERLAYGGPGVARADGFAIFVEGAAPDERVRARIRRTYRRHAEADLVSIEAASPSRVQPRCPHVEEGCGGCGWQHVAYPAQLATKAEVVRDSLARLAGLRELPMRAIEAAPAELHYRNKMEFAFHPNGTLGLHPRGAWYDILRLRECYLGPPLAIRLVEAARGFVEERGLSLFHPRTREGLLRELIVRASRSTGEILVGIVTASGPFPEARAMAERLAAVDPAVVGVLRSIRGTADAGAPLGETTVLLGRDHVSETTAGLRFRIHLDTFYQTNSAQAERLVELVLELAGDVAGAEVVDVYCGVGLFSLALAARGARVTGVEMVESAVAAARENAASNRLSSLTFHAGDARKVLAEVLPAGSGPRVVVLDPPRAGAGGKVMRRIARARPARIVYVSCNPTTLARDLVELRPFGYRVTAVHPLDLFPQTYHVETVVALEASGAPDRAAEP